MKRYTQIALLLFISCAACEEQVEVFDLQSVTIEDLYTIDLPSRLKSGYDMHDYASLQYYDTLSNLYVIGIEDAKENLGQIKRRRLKQKSYFKFVESTVFSDVDSLVLETEQDYQLGPDLSLRAGDYYARSKNWGDIPVFYRIAVYENYDYFFQLVIWMPYQDHCKELNTWTDSTMRSFSFMNQGELNRIGER
ncbi:MAG: hypothetical protein AAGD28_22415 [Bacteroidota bacterium]